MKKILVPTDFSANALNALKYAIAIAEKTHASIMLHHAFRNHSDSSGIVAKTYEMLLDDNTKRLNDLITDVQKSTKTKVAITPCLLPGTVRDTVPELAKSNKVDLVVMGTRGASANLETIFGSHTAALAHELPAPLLAIPLDSKFKPIERILFASDFHFVNDDDALDSLNEIATMFHAKVTLLNIRSHAQPTAEEVLESQREAHSLSKGVKYKIASTFGTNVTNGVIDYLDVHDDIDLIAMLARKHNWIERLFGSSHTEEMVQYTKLPLLIMHDGEARKSLHK